MLEIFGLYLILTDPVAGYESCAEAAVSEGVRYLQLRMKDRPRQQVAPVASRLRRITQGTSTRFIVNDDLAVAMEVDADGVHLGQHDMRLDDARKAWTTEGKLFGLSTHDEEQELAARALAPDLIGVGPVFPTPTKKIPDPVLGVERAGKIIRSSPLTTVAIGGIDERNLGGLLDVGVRNFAVVRAVNGSDQPRAAIAKLMRLWRDHPVGATQGAE
ncbi:MAG: thiamine phosphate synthase [Deltaproteobacteria bacterium]|nr:thiamine phosphate synthase [Deltaproteobacteria bacterium]